MIISDNPHSMGAGCNELCDSASKGGRRIHREDGYLVLSVSDALFEFDDGEEVGTGGSQKMGRRRSGHVLNIDEGDVAYKHFLMVNNRNGRDSAGGHQFQSRYDSCVYVD